MRILMAADGSKEGTAALVSACRILSAPNRQVDVQCVIPKVHPRNTARQKKMEDRAVRRIGNEVLLTLKAEGIDAELNISKGSPARILIQSSTNYDVAVVGAKSHSEANPSGLGPVASRLAEHANTSVLLSRPSAGDATVSILVPVDGSTSSMDALDKLGALTDLRKSEVTLMHVVETPWVRPIDEQDLVDSEDESMEEEPSAELEKEFSVEAEALLEEARKRIPRAAGVRTMITRGIPAEQIFAEAEGSNYDLVVMAASGERDVKHRILGSVSAKVAWNAPCSVLLVHLGG